MFEDLIPQENQIGYLTPRIDPVTKKLNISTQPMGFDDLIPQQAPEPSTLQQIGRQAGLAGRYAVEGLASIPGMVANVPASIYNAVTPGDYKFPDQNAALSNILTEAGLPEPQGATERVVGDVSRAMMGAGAGARSAALAGEKFIGSPLAQQIAQRAAQVYNVKPVAQTIAAGTGAGSAGATREMGGSPLAQVVAGIAGGGAPLAVSAIKDIPKTVYNNLDDLTNKSRQAYARATQKGGVLSETLTDKWLDNAGKAAPQTEAGKLMSGDSPVTKLVEKMQSLRGRKLTLDEAQEIDEFLGDTVDEFSEMGRLTKQGKKVFDIQTSFRNMIEEASESDIVGGKEGFNALKEGRSAWSKAARLRDVEKIISRAEMMDNPATGLKTGFRNLYSNSNRLKGYTAQEKALIKRAAESNAGIDVLRTLGSRLIPMITAGSGGGLGSTAAATAATMASRGAATRLQVNRAQKVAKTIAGVKK